MRKFVRVGFFWCCLSIAVLLPTSAWAVSYSGGSGTAENPYIIASLEDLKSLASNVRDKIKADAHYVQSGDIDMANVPWELPIGNDPDSFQGHYDGREFSIRNLTIVNKKRSCTGLFGYVKNTVIRNVVLEASFVSSDATAPTSWEKNRTRLSVGGLVGEARDSTIFNCRVSGDVRGGIAGNGGATYTGGLTGCIAGTKTKIIACVSRGTVNGGKAMAGSGKSSQSFTGGLVGGLVGGSLDEPETSGLIGYCTNESLVNGGDATVLQTGNVSTNAGGLIGFAAGLTIDNCANEGRVASGLTTLGSQAYTGGIVGQMSSGSLSASWSGAPVVRNSSNAGNRFTGGLVGMAWKAKITGQCFFLSGDLKGVDQGISDQSFIVALPREDFLKPETFADWKIDNAASAWFCEEGTPPKLKHFFVEPAPCMFVFSEDVAGRIPFALKPAYEGFAVRNADCGDGFSVISSILPEGSVCFDGSGFSGEKELRIPYTMEGLETSAKIVVRTAPIPDPEPTPNPDPEPEPSLPAEPEPSVPPKPPIPPIPINPVPPAPDPGHGPGPAPQPAPEIVIPAQPEPIYAESGPIEVVFHIRGTVEGTAFTGLHVGRYPADWDPNLTAAFEEDSLVVSGSPSREGVYVLEIRGRVDGIPFKTDVTLTILPKKDVGPGDSNSGESGTPGGGGGCSGGWAWPALFPVSRYCRGKKRMLKKKLRHS